MFTASDGTAYKVLVRDNGTFAVEAFPDAALPVFVEGFKSKPEAEQWIYEHATARGSKLPQYAGNLRTTPGV